MAILRECVIVLSSVIPLTRVQPNILVDAAGHPRITDFRLSTVIQSLDSVRNNPDDQNNIHVARWTAPEILNEQGTYSKGADIFSFAMVMIEVRCGRVVWALTQRRFVPPQVFTGGVPFDNSSTTVALLAIMNGKRPSRPSHPDFTDELWTLTQRCWDQDPHLRFEVTEVLKVLGGLRPLSFGDY